MEGDTREFPEGQPATDKGQEGRGEGQRAATVYRQAIDFGRCWTLKDRKNVMIAATSSEVN